MGALAARSLCNQEPVALERGGVVLHHLHVHQRRAGAVGERDAVAGADQRVGGRVVDLAVAACREDHGLGGEQLHRAVAHVARHHSGDLSLVVADERGVEPLLVAVDLVVLHELLVEHVEDGLAGDVGHVVGAGRGGAAEGARSELALLVAVEGHAEVLEIQDLLGRGLAHDLDRVLVAEVVGALHGVEGVRLPGVLRAESGIDAALRRVGVRAHRVDLGEDSHGCALLCGRQGRALAGEAGPDYEDVMAGHGAAILCKRLFEPVPSCQLPVASQAVKVRSLPLVLPYWSWAAPGRTSIWAPGGAGTWKTPPGPAFACSFWPFTRKVAWPESAWAGRAVRSAVESPAGSPTASWEIAGGKSSVIAARPGRVAASVCAAMTLKGSEESS